MLEKIKHFPFSRKNQIRSLLHLNFFAKSKRCMKKLTWSTWIAIAMAPEVPPWKPLYNAFLRASLLCEVGLVIISDCIWLEADAVVVGFIVVVNKSKKVFRKCVSKGFSKNWRERTALAFLLGLWNKIIQTSSVEVSSSMKWNFSKLRVFASVVAIGCVIMLTKVSVPWFRNKSQLSCGLFEGRKMS